MKTGHLLVIVYIFGITSAVTGCETDGSAKIIPGRYIDRIP